jgi:hypothetical protein
MVPRTIKVISGLLRPIYAKTYNNDRNANDLVNHFEGCQLPNLPVHELINPKAGGGGNEEQR